ncbi:MAG: PilZ domain-containing protein [Candidatus Omnitrophota bacterium]
MKEQRRYKRVKLGVKVEWEKIPVKSGSSTLTSGMSMNISKGGICIAMDKKEVEQGDILHLTFKLPEEEEITSKAEVQWVKENFVNFRDEQGKKYDVGIKFLEISDKDREKIEEFVLMHP